MATRRRIGMTATEAIDLLIDAVDQTSLETGKQTSQSNRQRLRLGAGNQSTPRRTTIPFRDRLGRPALSRR